MNLQTFTDKQKDKLDLAKALKTFSLNNQTADERKEIMMIANLEQEAYQQINLAANSNSFTNSILANFQNYRIDKQGDYYYPMGRLLEYLLISYQWNEDEQKLLNNFIKQGEQKLKALTLRQAIGRIESSPDPKPENGIGTGILIAPNLLLTCSHIFTKNQIKQAWVRFNYTESSYNLDEDLFELDLNFIKSSSQLDYALIQSKGQPKQKPIKPINVNLNAGQNIRIIHHPAGEKIIVSELGEIVKVGKDYIDHNLNTDEGSSGAPIFDQDWQFVAIHRGHPGINAGRDIPPGITSGVPIYAFLAEIQTYLS